MTLILLVQYKDVHAAITSLGFFKRLILPNFDTFNEFFKKFIYWYILCIYMK